MKTMTAGLIVSFAMLALCEAEAAGTDKTLVSWVCLANTTQQGGSALTIQRDDEFDGIVFGEREAGRWMAGSDFFKRTQNQQGASAAENADAKMLVQMAIVYKGNQISLYRNGELYASYETSNIDLLTAKDNQAVFGLRHEGAGAGQHLRGWIEDARIYERALSADEGLHLVGVEALKLDRVEEVVVGPVRELDGLGEAEIVRLAASAAWTSARAS